LIDDYVKEEVYVREASVLGSTRMTPSSGAACASRWNFSTTRSPMRWRRSTYLKANPGAFEIAPMLAFQQVFLNPDRYGHRIDQDAASILDVLMTSPATDPARSAMPRCFLRNLCSKTSIGGHTLWRTATIIRRGRSLAEQDDNYQRLMTVPIADRARTGPLMIVLGRSPVRSIAEQPP